MTTTQSGMAPAFVQIGLKAFGDMPKDLIGLETASATRAIDAVFGGIRDRRQVLAALRAYRRYYSVRSPESLMRLMLEAARDWQPKKVWEIPDFTGRDYATEELRGSTTEALEQQAFEKAAAAFGHRRLQVSTSYTIRDTVGTAQMDGKLRALSITVHELAPPDPDA